MKILLQKINDYSIWQTVIEKLTTGNFFGLQMEQFILEKKKDQIQLR